MMFEAREMSYESMHGRPIIVGWLTRSMVFLASFMLIAAIVALIGCYRQAFQELQYSAVKPAGDVFDIVAFDSELEAKSFARQIRADHGIHK